MLDKYPVLKAESSTSDEGREDSALYLENGDVTDLDEKEGSTDEGSEFEITSVSHYHEDGISEDEIEMTDTSGYEDRDVSSDSD